MTDSDLHPGFPHCGSCLSDQEDGYFYADDPCCCLGGAVLAGDEVVAGDPEHFPWPHIHRVPPPGPYDPEHRSAR